MSSAATAISRDPDAFMATQQDSSTLRDPDAFMASLGVEKPKAPAEKGLAPNFPQLGSYANPSVPPAGGVPKQYFYKGRGQTVGTGAPPAAPLGSTQEFDAAIPPRTLPQRIGDVGETLLPAGGRGLENVAAGIGQGVPAVGRMASSTMGAQSIQNPHIDLSDINEAAGGARKVIAGGMEAALPYALPAMAMNPLRTAVGIGSGVLAQGATEGGLNLAADKVGVPAGSVNNITGLVGDAAGLYAGVKAGEAVKGLQSRIGQYFFPTQDPYQLMYSAHKPRAGNLDFGQQLETSMPEIKATEATMGPVKGLEDELNRIKLVKQQNRQQFNQLIDPRRQRLVDLSPLADARDASVQLKRSILDPDQVTADLDKNDNYRKRLFTLDETEQILKETNAELDGFYAKYPRQQWAALQSDPDFAATYNEARAARTALYDNLDQNGQGALPRELQRRYGAMLDLEQEGQRRFNVAKRQQLISLAQQAARFHGAGKIALGAVKGIATKGASGMFDIAQGVAERLASDAIRESGTTDAMIRRAFENYPKTPPRPLPPYNPVQVRGLLPPAPHQMPPAPDQSYVTGVPPAPHQQVQMMPRALPPASSGIGVSGTIVPPDIGAPPRTPYNAGLLEAGPPPAPLGTSESSTTANGPFVTGMPGDVLPQDVGTMGYPEHQVVAGALEQEIPPQVDWQNARRNPFPPYGSTLSLTPPPGPVPPKPTPTPEELTREFGGEPVTAKGELEYSAGQTPKPLGGPPLPEENKDFGLTGAIGNLPQPVAPAPNPLQSYVEQGLLTPDGKVTELGAQQLAQGKFGTMTGGAQNEPEDFDLARQFNGKPRTGGVQQPSGVGNEQGIGKETTILRTGKARDEGYRGVYRVREAGELEPSHNPFNFEPNPNHAHGNTRDYTKPEAQERVLEDSGPNFNEDYHINDNPDAINGPPITDANGHALGGNSRLMSLFRIFSKNLKAASAYKARLIEKASQFGLDPDQITKMKNPVLVREIHDQLTPEQYKDAIDEFNRPSTAKMQESERALADARRVTTETLQNVGDRLNDKGPDTTLANLLGGPDGPEIINRLVKDNVLTSKEAAGMANDSGVLTDEAKERVSNALIGRMFDNTTQFNNTPPEVRNRLERVVGPLARGEGQPGWDLTEQVRNAVRLLEETRQHGTKNLKDVIEQHQLFSNQIPPHHNETAVAIAEHLKDTPPNLLGRMFTQYGADAAQAPNQSMFGPQVTPESSFAKRFLPWNVPFEEYGSAENQALADARGTQQANAGKTPEIDKALGNEVDRAAKTVKLKRAEHLRLVRWAAKNGKSIPPEIYNEYASELAKKETPEAGGMATGGVVAPEDTTLPIGAKAPDIPATEMQEISAMAAGGTVTTGKTGKPDDGEVVRGSIDIPLSGQGVFDTVKLAKDMARRGGVHRIAAGPLTRTRQTAQILKNYSPKAPVGLVNELQAWHMGGLEGKPKQQVKRQIETYVRRPDVVPPGQSPESTAPGESYGSFSRRVMRAVKQAMQSYLAHPNSVDALVVHRSIISWLHGWLKAGMPADGHVDPSVVLDNSPKEGAYRFAPIKGGKWGVERVPVEAPGRNKPGIYFIPHGLTSANHEDKFSKGSVVEPQAA